MFESLKSHLVSINFEYLFSAGGGPVKNRLNAPSSNWSRISAFHAGDTGSSPVGVTRSYQPNCIGRNSIILTLTLIVFQREKTILGVGLSTDAF